VSKLRQRTVFGVAVVVLGLALFVVASAFVVDRGYSPILAAIVGGFAFPVAPLVWQLVGERRRSTRLAAKPAKGAAAPKPSTLTKTDRFWMRFVAVALVVLGPMVAIGRFQVVRATFRHGLWFVPTPPPDLRGLGEGTPRTFEDQALLFRHVPPESEAVFVFHDPNAGGNLVGAWAGGKSAVISSGEILLPGGQSLGDIAHKISWLLFDPVHEVGTGDGTDVLASDSWRAKVQLPGDGPTLAMRKELARAPQAADVVVGWVPRTPREQAAIRGGAGWLVLDGDRVVLEGRLETTNIAVAIEAYARANAQLVGEHAGRSDACRRGIETLADHTTIVQNGLVITARAVLTRAATTQLLACVVPGLPTG
jgi:hypothetical protein